MPQIFLCFSDKWIGELNDLARALNEKDPKNSPFRDDITDNDRVYTSAFIGKIYAGKVLKGDQP